MAAYGQQIPDNLRAGGPAATGGRKGTYTPQASQSDALLACATSCCALLTRHARYFAAQVEAFAQELAQTSLAHIKVLRDLLGNSSPACPAIELGNSWPAIANSALNSQLQPAFDPYGARMHAFSCCVLHALDGVAPPQRTT